MAKKDINSTLNVEQSTNKKDEVVEVKKEDLNRLLERLDKYEKDIGLLYKAADKSSLQKAINQDNKVLVHTIKIAKWDDTPKHVIGWGPLVKNKAEVVLGRYIEEQVRKIFLEDGEEIEVPYLESFRRMLTLDEAEIVSKETSTNSDGEKTVMLKIRLPNGKLLLIDEKFANSK